MPSSPAQRRIILGGLLLRAIAGLLLLWISWSGHPVGGDWSLGEGRWSFALDADTYRANAALAASRGIGRILSYDRSTPAISYVQLLALFVTVFGDSVLTALLVNLVCYLLMGWLVSRWAAMIEAPPKVTLFVLTALSFSPSAILWATQPLKESFFQLVVVALVFAALVWQRAWQASRFGVAALAASGMVGLLFLLAGIRWYYAAIALPGLLLAFTLTLKATTRGRIVIALGALPLVLLLGRAVMAGGGDRVLPYLRKTMRLDPESVVLLPVTLTIMVPEIRDNLASSGGNSMIVRADASAPVTHLDRLVTGTLATFAPLTLLHATEWVRIQSGGVYRVLADIDTLFFDAVVIAGLLLSRRRRRTSVYVLVAAVTLVIAVAVVYTIPNFGLLFRLRLLILTGCALLPLAAWAGAEKEGRDVLDTTERDDVDVGVDLRRV